MGDPRVPDPLLDVGNLHIHFSKIVGSKRVPAEIGM
jgi:hypothetical protein